MAALPPLECRVRWRWWWPLYFRGVVCCCLLTGARPDYDRVMHWALRAFVVEIFWRGGWRRV